RQDARRYARGERLPRTCQDRQSGPQSIGAGRMSGVVARVQKEVGQTMAAEMLGFADLVGKDDAVRIDAPLSSLPAYVGFELRRQLQQPEDAARNLLQDTHPDVEDEGLELVVVVEAAIDEAFFRQPTIGTVDRRLVDGLVAVVHLIAIRQINELLAVEALF